MALSGLDSALSGLRVAQQQLNVISNNVANVNSEGYTRKVLPQQSLVVSDVSAGARTGAVIRNVDLNLERDFWTQVSKVNALDIKGKYLDQIQQFHGPPDLEISVAAQVAELRDVFASLADSPEDNFLQRKVVDQAESVAGKINGLAKLLTKMRNDAQEDISTSVDNINTMLNNIADINAQIKFNSAGGKTTAELEDRRDKVIKDLSAEIDISFFTRGDGVMVVQTKKGVQLADEHALPVYYNRTPMGASSYYPDPNNPNVNGIFVGGNPATNPVAIDITQDDLSGKVGALLELRDQILPENQAMLDELAHKLALRFQEQGLTLFTDRNGNVPADSTALLIGSTDIVALAPAGPLSAAAGNPWGGTAGNDRFTITLNPNGTAPPAEVLTIELSDAEAFSPPAPDGAGSLVNYINFRISQLPDSFGNTVASLDANGQLNIASDYDIQISTGAGQMGVAGLAFLGLTPGTEYAAPKATPLTPVSYVGFANEFRVNQNVLDDNRLVQQGTVATDLAVQDGSNEVIRRVLEFTFGDLQYQEAVGNIDLRAAANGTTLQDWLGIYSQNAVAGTKAITSTLPDLLTAGADPFNLPPAAGPVTASFNLTFEEARSVPPVAPTTFNIDLATIIAAGPTAADDIVNEINTQIGLSALPAGFASASVNGYGQIVINSRGNITIDASFIGGMQQDGLDFLGLTEGTYVTTDPYIDVQIGNDDPKRITIEPGDDEFDLFDKLDLALPGDLVGGVAGLAVDDDLTNANINAGGTLILRPGDSSTSPTFGGDIKIIGGPFTSNGTGLINGVYPPGTVPNGASIIEALFGSDNPVIDVPHELSVGTGQFEAFRRINLGPNAKLDTGIISSTNLIDYAQKLVNRQTAERLSIDSKQTDETSYRDLLSRRLLDESGVNMEEELSNMIIIQSAFAAAARVIAAIDDQFQELINAFR